MLTEIVKIAEVENESLHPLCTIAKEALLEVLLEYNLTLQQLKERIQRDEQPTTNQSC